MALILEVIAGRDEVRQRVRVDAFPFTVGRAYASDLILDDPYVDASHARIVREENGDCYIEDGGSLNGVSVGDGERVARLRLGSGTSLRIGRTLLRVRDTSDAVAPALRDGPTAGGRAPRLLGKRRLAGVIAGSAVVVGVVSWLNGYERAGSGGQFTNVLGFGLIAVAWAGCWAIASRITRHRFHMLEHLAIFSAAITAVMILGTLASLVAFFVPSLWVTQTVGALYGVLVLTALLAAHLAHTSRLSLKRRATIGFSIAAGFLALGLVAQFAKAEDYTDVPSFVGALAPVSAKLIPADGPEELERAAAALKPEVDALRKNE